MALNSCQKWHVLILQEVGDSVKHAARLHGHLMVTADAHWRSAAIVINSRMERYIQCVHQHNQFATVVTRFPVEDRYKTMSFVSAYMPHQGKGDDEFIENKFGL